MIREIMLFFSSDWEVDLKEGCESVVIAFVNNGQPQGSKTGERKEALL